MPERDAGVPATHRSDEVGPPPERSSQHPSAPTAVAGDPVVRIPPAGGPGGEAPALRPVLRVDEARRRALRPWAIAGAAAVVVAVGAVGLVASPVFEADTIAVAGERHLSEAQVRRVAGVDHDTNVFRLDEGSVERRLARDPWILRATVTASLPSTIRIDVVERAPVAVAVTSAGPSLVAEDGTLLGPGTATSAYPEIRAATPAATAGDAPAGGAAAHTASGASAGETSGLAEPVDEHALKEGAKVAGALTGSLRTDVEAIEVSGDGTITLRLENGVPVAFGHASELDAKSQALTAILSYARGSTTPLVSIDVSTPAAPTARFVGITVQSVSPSKSERQTDDARGRASDTSPSPSPSP